MATIRCENICKSFGKGNAKTDAVQGITATFSTGNFYSIIGKSGSGKSTLLHLLSGILQPDSGCIYYNDVPIHTMRRSELDMVRRTQVGFVFQDYQLLPEITVKENILMPLILNHSPIDEQWCTKIMGALNISGIADKYPHTLSGGEQQRVAIGRAIIHRPPFFFADEPTGNLDKKSSGAVLNLLLEIRKLYDPMILLVTHDLDIARSADKLFHIEDGKLCNPLPEVTQ